MKRLGGLAVLISEWFTGTWDHEKKGVAIMRRPKKLIALASGAAAAAGLAAVIVPATSASAQAGVFTLCSEGGYYAYASFAYFDTFAVPGGDCFTTTVSGNYNQEVSVYDASTGQYIGSTIYNGAVGETIVTIPGPSFYAYNG